MAEEARFASNTIGVIPGSQVEVSVPASVNWLPVLSEAVREYCAILPVIFGGEQVKRPPAEARPRQFGTSRLVLPNSNGQAIETSFTHFVYSVQLILQEAATNVVRHGYDAAPDLAKRYLFLNLSAANFLVGEQQNQQSLIMVLSDTADPFDPTTAPVRAPNPLEPQEGGYGLYLIKKLTDHLEYSHENGRNHLKMIKYIGQ
jgi:anti-sigma regulatory factor (Ser/Thr protein kinase)